MGLFPSIISVIFSMGFLVLLFLFAWYVALPVIFILLVIGLFNFFRGKSIFYQVGDLTNIISGRNKRHAGTASRQQDEKIIDVDYTELP